MNTVQMKTNEVALLLHALRAVYVADEEETRQRLMRQLEGDLKNRGARLSGDSQVAA